MAYKLLAFIIIIVVLIWHSPRIIDGDTIVLDGRKIRFWGIDSPELKQDCYIGEKIYHCGQLARRELIMLINGRTVTCEVVDVDIYNRDVAICFAGSVNLNSQMVKNGWALNYGGDFIQEEKEARENKRGIWAMKFQEPRSWRRYHR